MILLQKKTKKKTKQKTHNPYCPKILDHPWRILMAGDSGSRKTNDVLNLINHEPDIDNIYLYAKDPYDVMMWLLIYLVIKNLVQW